MTITFCYRIQTLSYILYVDQMSSRPIVVKMGTMAGQRKQKMVTKKHYVP